MFVNRDYQSPRDLRTHERLNQAHVSTLLPSPSVIQYNTSASVDRTQSKKIDREEAHVRHIPKLVQTQFAQFLNSLLEYSSELTYFAINAFQTSSLRRVQINTLQRFTGFCVPRACAFYYNLDTEFDSFVQKMRLLCALAKRTFLDIRVTRIHSSDGRMMSLPITRRSIDIFKCNINRLRDLKQIHRDIGYDLLLPNDQLYLALDLLITDFELLNCELDAEVKFADAMILQTIIKDIFLQFRIALTWIYPAVKYAAYRPGEPDSEQAIRKCDQQSGAIPRPDDFCGKQKKGGKSRSMKSPSSSELQPPTQTKAPRRNVNQNFAEETAPDSRSAKYRKKRRKCSANSRGTPTAIGDVQQYLHEKKRTDVGIINIKKPRSSRIAPRTIKFNHIVSVHSEYSDRYAFSSRLKTCAE